jgi:hypothetical protein
LAELFLDRLPGDDFTPRCLLAGEADVLGVLSVLQLLEELDVLQGNQGRYRLSAPGQDDPFLRIGCSI